MVALRQYFIMTIICLVSIGSSILAQETVHETKPAKQLTPKKQILGTWKGGPEGMQEATFTFMFNGSVFIDDEKARWTISGESEPYTLTLSYKNSFYEDEVWGLSFESDSTLMFYIGEAVEILMKKVE